jgi:soluble lytic murein transglycosylase
MSIVSLAQHLNTHRGAADGVGTARREQLAMAAEQFEALFLQQILKQMRKASDVLAADNPMRSRELDSMRDFYDEVLAETLAGKKQTGIADLLVKQLSGEAGQALDIQQAGALAREAELPARSPSLLEPLRSTWQRGVDGLAGAWQRGTAGFVALVDRVIQQESAGRVDAVSAKGARGIMQLMPDTAREMAAELGLAFDEARLTRDADYNKQLGSAYLGKLLERYDGEPALALAAYNAGPARVDEWLQRHGDPRRGEIGVTAWVERIPYQETRDYTRRILRDLPPTAAAQPPAAVPPLPPGARAATIESARFKSPADYVALQERTADFAADGIHRSHSAAFAQPIRVERKETDS